MLGLLAALSGAIAVITGAFGAHGAEARAAELFRTGAHYQLVHAVAVLVAIRFEARGSGWLFLAGSALFGLSLYLLALGGPRWLGAVTPLGGALMIAGWLWLAWNLRP